MTIDLDRLRDALAPRFRLEEEVGRGGMAVVFAATDLRHDRRVAVKVLRPGIAGQVGAERFLQEIRIESKLQHPNILPLLDSGEADGLPYYIMPFIEGSSLADRLAQEGQLPVDDALRIAAQAGSALAHAHAQGIVHRDVKPENILLAGGQALVADFGIARAAAQAGGARITSSGLVLGTPAYMSPEQGAGGEIDGRSDQYALACVVHQMLVGEPPFRGPTAQAIIARHALERPPSIPVVRPAVPPHVVAAVERALQKAPADRFPTIEAFVAALQNPGWWQASAPTPTRRRLVAAGTVAILAATGWLAFRPAPTPLDANRVIVHPLEARGFAPEDSGAGHDVALMITAGLEHSEPLRGYDAASGLPASLRARYRLDGVVRRDADSTVVVLRLFDLAGDSLVAQQSATAPTGGRQPYEIAFQALRPLLPRILDPGRRVDLGGLMDRRVSAVALWIQGEHRYRQGRFAEALDFYHRAVADDSALVMAAVKGAQAASWTNRHGDAGALAALAIGGEALLPARFVQFARGVAAYVQGEADSALAWFDAALATSPDWSEAHMAAGETAYHLIPARVVPDDFAEQAFVRARAADPGFLPPAVHLAEIAIRRGDLAGARRQLRDLQVAPPDSALLRQLDLMMTCVAGDLDQDGWHAAARISVEAVNRAGQALAVGAAQPACSEAAFRAALSAGNATFHWGAFLGLRGILLAQGRVTEAIALTDSLVAKGTVVARSLYLLDEIAGHPVAAQADGFMDFFRATFGDTLERLGRSPSGARSRWLAGSWLLHRDQRGPVAGWQQAVARIADSLDSRSARVLAAGLQAQLRLAAADTTTARGLLARLVPTAPRDTLQWDLAESLPVERLLRARLALAAGNPAEALRIAGGFDQATAIISLGFIPASLELRLRAAEALGRPDLIRAFRARQERLRASVPPSAGGRP